MVISECKKLSIGLMRNWLKISFSLSSSRSSFFDSVDKSSMGLRSGLFDGRFSVFIPFCCKRNVWIRFASLPNKASSHRRGSFLTRGISDSSSVKDRQNMVDGIERFVQVAPIFVVRRLTRVVLHCIDEPCTNSRQANARNAYLRKFCLVCFTPYGWAMTKRQYGIRPIKLRSINVVKTRIHHTTKNHWASLSHCCALICPHKW